MKSGFVLAVVHYLRVRKITVSCFLSLKEFLNSHRSNLGCSCSPGDVLLSRYIFNN